MKTIVLWKKVESYTVSIATVSINDLTVSIQAHLLSIPQDVSTSLLLYGTPFFFYKCIVFEIFVTVNWYKGKLVTSVDEDQTIRNSFVYIKYINVYCVYNVIVMKILLTRVNLWINMALFQKWISCFLVMSFESTWNPVNGASVPAPQNGPSTIEAQAKFFQ